MKDLSLSYRYYHSAADNGNAKAQYSAGMMLGMGIGTDRSYKEGHRYLKLAAKQGYQIEK